MGSGKSATTIQVEGCRACMCATCAVTYSSIRAARSQAAPDSPGACTLGGCARALTCQRLAQAQHFLVALVQRAFQPLDVVEQPRRRQAQEIEPEPRVLVVELLDLFIGNREHRTALGAHEGLRAGALGGKHAELADHRARREIEIDL